MSNYDNGFARAQRDYERQLPPGWHEDLEKEQRREEAKEHQADIEREERLFDEHN